MGSWDVIAQGRGREGNVTAASASKLMSGQLAARRARLTEAHGAHGAEGVSRRRRDVRGASSRLRSHVTDLGPPSLGRLGSVRRLSLLLSPCRLRRSIRSFAPTGRTRDPTTGGWHAGDGAFTPAPPPAPRPFLQSGAPCWSARLGILRSSHPQVAALQQRRPTPAPRGGACRHRGLAGNVMCVSLQGGGANALRSGGCMAKAPVWFGWDMHRAARSQFVAHATATSALAAPRCVWDIASAPFLGLTLDRAPCLALAPQSA